MPDDAAICTEQVFSGTVICFDNNGNILATTEKRSQSPECIPLCGSGCRECAFSSLKSEPTCGGCPVSQVLASGEPCNREQKDAKGRINTITCYPMFNFSGELMGAVKYNVSTLVSEKMYADLLHSRERLAATMESANLAWWEENFRTGEVTRSDEWAEMLGYASGEIPAGKEFWLELIHPDDLSDVLEAAKKHEMGETEVFEVEHRMRNKDGSWKWVHNWGRIVERDEFGKPVRALGTHLDITRRKSAEFARKDLIVELRTALSRIQTLKGIIPICAHCKRIRNDSGYWEQLEIFISQHSMAEFSHGLCPECGQKHYGEILPGEQIPTGGTMKKLEYAKGVVFRREPAGGILFNIDTGDLQVTEGVAFGICDMIDNGKDRENILSELQKHYPEEQNLERDLDDFIKELKEKGALV
ncbi:MAG: PqqD family peptide modification chaperone [Candidatus Sabulitectum sp.]|nr:PqqD family peptide modification chaperone [Candidatus Sabulitectum sp.]